MADTEDRLRRTMETILEPHRRPRRRAQARSPPRDHHRPAEAPFASARRGHAPPASIRRADPERRRHTMDRPGPAGPCPPQRGRPHGQARAAQVKEAATAKRPRREMHSPPMPASQPPCVATARSWPTAPAGDGRTQCDSLVCSTRPDRVPPVGSGLPAMRQPASFPSCHRPGRTGPGPLAARPGREGSPGRFWLMGEGLSTIFRRKL